MHERSTAGRLCQPHEIKRVADESTSESEEGQRAHRGDK